MKLKRLMTASMAAVMAVSSAIVCQISVSAAETDITSQITSGISVSELSQYTSLKVTYKPSPTADGKCGHTHDDGSTYCPWAQVPFIANSVEGMDADIDPVKKKSTWYQPDSAFTAKSGKDEKETTAEVDVADIINSFTSDKDWKDTFTLKSVTVQCWGGTLSKVVGVTGSEDTRTDAKIPDYDASPITMTKQAAQSWCPNGTAQGMIPVTIDGITTGTTTYGEIKDKFKNITFNGIDFVKDSIGGSASDYTYCLYAQWGSGWSWTASDSVSLDSKTKWSLTSLAEEYQKQNKATLNDDDVLQVIGIQINMADNNNLPAGVAALNIDEKFTINPAGAAVESVEITLTDGTAVASSYTYGDTINLKATVLPEGAVGADKVEWTSENPTVATVDENGKVTLLKAGPAKITATAGGKSNSVTFTVVQQSISATNIELDAFNKTMTVGDKAKLTATVKPADSTDKVTWKSNNDKIVSVDENGNITALAVGKTEVIATAGSVSAQCTITVAKEAQNIKDTKKYPSIPKDYAKVDPVVTTVNSDGSKNMLIMFSISDSDVDSYRGARITFKRADGKTFSRSLILGKYYTDVTYVKDGGNYNGNSQNYIVIRLKNVQDSWGDISAKFELINGLG